MSEKHNHPPNVSITGGTGCSACREEAEAKRVVVYVCPECGPSPAGACAPWHAFECSQPECEKWWYVPLSRVSTSKTGEAS